MCKINKCQYLISELTHAVALHTDPREAGAVCQALPGVGWPIGRDSALPLRHPLLLSHDCLFLPRPHGALHPTLSQVTGKYLTNADVFFSPQLHFPLSSTTGLRDIVEGFCFFSLWLLATFAISYKFIIFSVSVLFNRLFESQNMKMISLYCS